MKKLNKDELLKIEGGTDLYTSSFINALVKAGDALLDLGRSLGSAIRRLYEHNSCPIK